MAAAPDQAITFLVPTYNRSGMLADCLDSIVRESGLNDEILVVDDGSTDQTAQILERYRANHYRPLRIEWLENGGKSRALNHGLRITKAPLVWIVDDDDVLLAGARQSLISLLEAGPGADFAYGRHERFADSPDCLPHQCPRLGTGYWTSTGQKDFLIATLEDMFAHQPGMLVRRSLYERVGPFDEELPRSIDYEMLVRLAEHGRAAGTDEVVFLQRQHDGVRGPAAAPVDGCQRDANWAARDREIFLTLRARLPLESYLPTRKIDSATHRRQALIQRGTIMARKGLWPQAMADYHTAVALHAKPLTETEQAIARRAFGSKYADGHLDEAALVTRGLAALAQTPGPGAELAKALVRGFYWHLKRREGRLGRVRTAADLTRAAWGFTAVPDHYRIACE